MRRTNWAKVSNGATFLGWGEGEEGMKRSPHIDCVDSWPFAIQFGHFLQSQITMVQCDDADNTCDRFNRHTSQWGEESEANITLQTKNIYWMKRQMVKYLHFKTDLKWYNGGKSKQINTETRTNGRMEDLEFWTNPKILNNRFWQANILKRRSICNYNNNKQHIAMKTCK